jgi:CRP-like cAMP-binding protein
MEVFMKIEGIEGLVGADLIQDTFLFKHLGFDETLSLSGLCIKEKAKKGEEIIAEGSLGQGLYLIEKGSVKVCKKGKGKVEEIAKLGRGELFGEMSLIEDQLTSASVIATTNVGLIVIKREDFENLISKNSEIAFKVYKAFCLTLSDRLRKTSEELTHLKARSGKKTKTQKTRK